MSVFELVEELNSAASDVTRQLPEAHIWTRWYRETRFRAAAERFLDVLYRFDVPNLSDSVLAETERLTRVAINVLETHLLLRYTHRDTEACVYFTDLIARLRDALDALDSGLPTNPKLRPSEEELFASLASDLARSAS